MQIIQLHKIPDYDSDNLVAKNSMKMTFLSEKIYCNSSLNHPNNTIPVCPGCPSLGTLNIGIVIGAGGV